MADAILAALGIREGGPMLAFDPAAPRRLEQLPWVRTATVERQLPGRVRIALNERVPLALWQLDGALSVIDRTASGSTGPRRRITPTCRWWSARARRSTRKSCSRCWPASRR